MGKYWLSKGSKNNLVFITGIWLLVKLYYIVVVTIYWKVVKMAESAQWELERAFCGSMVKNPTVNAGDSGDSSLTTGEEMRTTSI